MNILNNDDLQMGFKNLWKKKKQEEIPEEEYENFYNFTTIKTLVRDITQDSNGFRNLTLPIDKIPDNTFEFENKDEYKDEDRPLKDIFTDVVTNIFLNNKSALLNFLTLINGMFSEALNIYCTLNYLKETDIFFILKGGNILRFIANDILFELPGNSSRNLHLFYKDFFKRSDCDFSIIINPDLENYDIIFQDISILAFFLLKRIQILLYDNPTDYFQWYKFSKNYKQGILRDILKELRELDLSENEKWKNAHFNNVVSQNVKTGGNQEYSHPVDMIIRFKERYNRFTPRIGWNLEESDNMTAVSYNETTIFEKNNRLAYFNLIRMKVYFTVQYDINNEYNMKRIGGELIDISIGNRNDPSTLKFYKNVKKYTAPYQISYLNEKINFKAFSLKYLFYDLFRILFDDIDVPWQDNKYVKRLNRIFYVGFINLFIKLSTNQKRIYYLNSFLNIILYFERVQNLNKKLKKKNIEKLVLKINKEKVFLNDVLSRIVEMYINFSIKKKIRRKKNKKAKVPDMNHDQEQQENKITNEEEELENRKNFLIACKENLNLLLQSFKEITLFCNKSDFKEENLYTNENIISTGFFPSLI